MVTKRASPKVFGHVLTHIAAYHALFGKVVRIINSEILKEHEGTILHHLQSEEYCSCLALGYLAKFKPRLTFRLWKNLETFLHYFPESDPVDFYQTSRQSVISHFYRTKLLHLHFKERLNFSKYVALSFSLTIAPLSSIGMCCRQIAC